MNAAPRIEVVHGVNLDMLGRRDSGTYGDLTFDQLEQRIERFAHELGLEARFFQTNHEGELVEHLHRIEETADGILINPGAWTHYSWALRDALEIAALPTVEVHLSDVDTREDFRKVSVISELVFARVKGKGTDGYRDALELLKKELA